MLLFSKSTKINVFTYMNYACILVMVLGKNVRRSITNLINIIQVITDNIQAECHLLSFST